MGPDPAGAVRAGMRTGFRTLVLGFLIVLAGCAPGPAPSAAGSPGPISGPALEPECHGLPPTEPGLCDRMVASVQEAVPEAYRDAVLVVVADTCPPRNLCDRAFLYDAVVAAVPGELSGRDTRLFHVFGHQAGTLTVEDWTGPLPDHVSRLLGSSPDSPAPDATTDPPAAAVEPEVGVG